MRVFYWWVISLMVFLFGCTPNLNNTLKDKPEVLQTQKMFQALIHNDFSVVRTFLTSEANQATRDEVLKDLAKRVPNQEPESVNILGWHENKMKSFVTGQVQKSSDATIEYYYGDNRWILTQAQFIEQDNQLKAQSFRMDFLNQSQAEKPWYSLAGLSNSQFVLFALTLMSLCFIVYVAVQCYRMPSFKRKWWWFAFCVLGVIQFGIFELSNTSQINFNLSPFVFLSPLRYWAFGMTLPIGAVWTFFHLRDLKRAVNDTPSLPIGTV